MRNEYTKANRGTGGGLSAMLLVFFLLISGIHALAQDAAARLQLQLTDAKEVKVIEAGQETLRLVPVDSTSSGDILVYTINYANNSDIPTAPETAVVGIIPKGTQFVAGSETSGDGLELLYSINNGENFLPQPVTVPVRQADGTFLQQSAPAEMYTHVRWILKAPVPPQGSGKVLYKVKVK